MKGSAFYVYSIKKDFVRICDHQNRPGIKKRAQNWNIVVYDRSRLPQNTRKHDVHLFLHQNILQVIQMLSYVHKLQKYRPKRITVAKQEFLILHEKTVDIEKYASNSET